MTSSTATSTNYASLVHSKYVEVIQPQILQYVSMLLTSSVNTGDRVRDGLIITIFNTIMFLALNGLLKCWLYIWDIIRFGYVNVLEEDHENTYAIMSKITKEKLEQYKYIYEVPNGYGIYKIFNVLPFKRKILTTFEGGSIYLYKSINTLTIIENVNGKYTQSQKSTIIANNSESLLAIPVYKYKNKHGVYEYIIYSNGKWYSNSYEELCNCIDYYAGIIDTAELNDAKKTNTSYITYELNASYELQIFSNTMPKFTFSNIHFDEKSRLMSFLDRFKENTLYPKDLPITNKLGILQYGPPGTGKSGCVQAMANYLKRGIIYIDVSTLTYFNKSKFRNALQPKYNNSIIVFDEFDHILDTMSSNQSARSAMSGGYGYGYAAHSMDGGDDGSGDDTENPTTKRLKLKLAIKNAKDAKERETATQELAEFNNDMKSHTTFDMSFLLGFLDGFGNDEGRIIVANTNNPDRIPAVLLRPGQFDLKLKLSFCSFDMFVNIVRTKFPAQVEPDTLTLETRQLIEVLLARNITPLNLINTLVVSDTFSELLDKMAALPKDEYNKECA